MRRGARRGLVSGRTATPSVRPVPFPVDPGDLPNMASDPKQTPTPESPSANHREKGVVIFTYSKIIFMFPTMIVALICGIGMSLTHDQTSDPLARPAEAQASGALAKAQAPREGDRAASTQAAAPDRHRRFTTPQ